MLLLPFNKKINLFLSFFLTFLVITLSVFTPLVSVTAQAGVPEFTPDYVLSDDSFRSSRAFPSSQSVQDYLNQVNSPLKNYRQNNKLASQIIFEAARGVTSSQYGFTPQINPGVIMAYIEKEMSLISNTSYDVNLDREGRVQKAMGYG